MTALPKGIQPVIELNVGNESVMKYTVAKVEKQEKIGLEQIFASFHDIGFFDTGLLARKDTGLINYRRAAGYESFVFQVAPGAHKIMWGDYEGGEADVYNVAMPYRIIIGDHQWNGKSYNMVGARHFYSYKPITSWNDILFHCNVPNLNCKGYSGTGVGWICLYHTADYNGFDLNKRIMATCMRTAGGEAYNDANMSSTDGPRFYEWNGKPSYFTNAKEWQKKTKKDGFGWVTDEKSDLLIPVKLNNPAKTEMTQHVPNGKDASLFDLTRGLYRAYYNHPVVLKPHNMMDPNNPFVSQYPKEYVNATSKYIQDFFDGKLRTMSTVQAKAWVPNIPKKKCDWSGNMFPEDDKFVKYMDAEGKWKTIHHSVMTTVQHVDLVYAYVPDGAGIKKTWVPKASTKQAGHDIVHTLVPHNECERCNSTYIGVGVGKIQYAHIEKHGYCSGCVDIFKCSSCTYTYPQGSEVLVTPTTKIQILIEDIKASIVESWEKGEEVTAKAFMMKAPEPYLLCSDCAQETKLCLCGHLITPDKAEQMACQTLGNGSVICSGCSHNNTHTKNIEYLPSHIQFQTVTSAVKIAKTTK